MAKGFAISISATDEVTQQVEKIKKSLFGLGRTAKEVGQDTGPVHQIGVQARAIGIVAREMGEHGVKAFERMSHAAESFGSKIGSFAPALGSLTSAATLAGFGEMTRDAANFGVSMTKASAALGMSTLEVQRWQKAWGQAGLSADQSAGMVLGLNDAIRDARNSKGAAGAYAHMFDIDVSGDQLRTLKSIADVIKRLHDEGQGPAVLQQVLNAFSLPMDALAQLEKGGDALEKLFRAQHDGLSAGDIDKLDDLGKAYRGVADAADEFGSKMVADVATPLAAASRAVQQFLDESRGMPGRMHAIEAAATALGASLTVGLLGRLVGLTSILGPFRSLFSAPAVAVAGVAAAGYGTAALVNKISGSDPAPWQSALPITGGPVTAIFGIGQLLHRFLGGNSPGPGNAAASVGRLGAQSKLSGSLAASFAASGLPPVAQRFMADIASGEATDFQQLAGRGPGSAAAYGNRSDIPGFPDWPGFMHDGQLSHGYGLFQDEYGTARKITAGAGITDWRDPVQQIKGNWWWAQKVYRDATGRDLQGDLESGSLDPRGRAALGTQWARGGVATGNGFNLGGDPTPAAGNTSHEVTVHIAGAPRGTRAEITTANGPSKLNLRTSYSLGDVW